MAKIYSAPDNIKRPSLGKDWQEDEKRYLNEVKAFSKKHGSGQYAGEIIRIPHADSSANYMVVKLKPVTLIHLETMDAWHSEYAELLTAKKVKEMVDREKALNKIFNHG